jgi:hypothetical protein
VPSVAKPAVVQHRWTDGADFGRLYHLRHSSVAFPTLFVFLPSFFHRTSFTLPIMLPPSFRHSSVIPAQAGNQCFSHVVALQTGKFLCLSVQSIFVEGNCGYR